jgi:hypothetical protein
MQIMKSRLITVFLFVSIITYSQNVHFNYDPNGNRSARYISGTPEDSLKSTVSQELLFPGSMLVSSDTNTGKMITIYPNPSDGNFFIIVDGARGDKCRITLYNISGQVIYKMVSIDTDIRISGEEIMSGVYIISIDLIDRSYRAKLVVL